MDIAGKGAATGRPQRGLNAVIRQAVEAATTEMGLTLSRLYLFGSRARDEADERSDWDILVVVRDELGREERRELFVRISQQLAEKRIPADIIIRTEAEFTKARTQVFSIEKIASEEGVLL
ncbi:nucleotidyltransferase domain-containing protein [Candidatus Bipolaricaulota bacterium]|nr:nucleotidyltransferase domain-containing protein [Candidatus Bipolaricaulota bacterium]